MMNFKTLATLLVALAASAVMSAQDMEVDGIYLVNGKKVAVR